MVHPQLRCLVAFIKSRCGFHGCSTLLLYWLSRSQSGARESSGVCHLLMSVHEDVAQCLTCTPLLLSHPAIKIGWRCEGLTHRVFCFVSLERA